MRHHSCTWSDDELTALGAMRQAGKRNPDIAAALGKSRGAVSGQIFRLGLPLICPGHSHHTPRGGKYADRRLI